MPKKFNKEIVPEEILNSHMQFISGMEDDLDDQEDMVIKMQNKITEAKEKLRSLTNLSESQITKIEKLVEKKIKEEDNQTMKMQKKMDTAVNEFAATKKHSDQKRLSRKGIRKRSWV